MKRIRRILVLGAGGRLGAALVREYQTQFAVTAITHADLDLADLPKTAGVISGAEFDLLINCAALTQVDYCESHRQEAFRVNAEAPRLLAELCQKKTGYFIHVSTDYVFDGKQREPYREDDAAFPLSIYGQSKRQGEEAVLAISNRFLVPRVSWVFGPDRPSFVDHVIERARQSEKVSAVADKFSTPTYTADLAGWLRVAWEGDAAGLLHLANGGECSWQEFAQHALDCCLRHGVKLKGTRVTPLVLNMMTNFVARRPVYTVLSTEKFVQLSGVRPRSWRDAVAEYVQNYIAET